MSIDQFFNKKYNADTYNCAHFVCEVWEHLYGEDIRYKLLPLLRPVKERNAPFELRKNFIRLREPEEPCIVLMHRRRCDAHVGLYIYGKLLHINDIRVELAPLKIATIGFDSVGFYR